MIFTFRYRDNMRHIDAVDWIQELHGTWSIKVHDQAFVIPDRIFFEA